MLPKITVPSFTVIQPSTKQELEIRPFLVKEERALLMAKESGERRDVYNAIRRIVQACVLTEGFDVDKIPVFDLEFLFLRLRACSINNVVTFSVKDSTDDQAYEIEVNLEDVEVNFPEGACNIIMIDESNGLKMKYPTPTIADRIADLESTTEITFETIDACIDSVFSEEEVEPWAQVNDKDRKDFLDNLPGKVYHKIEEFFHKSPSIEHVVTYTNSLDQEKRVVFKDLEDFFTLG